MHQAGDHGRRLTSTQRLELQRRIAAGETHPAAAAAVGCSTKTVQLLLSRSDGLSLSYDGRNFTVSATPPGGSAISMAYTGIDQTQRVASGAISFVYDLMGLSRRADASGTVYGLRDNTGQLLSERLRAARFTSSSTRSAPGIGIGSVAICSGGRNG